MSTSTSLAPVSEPEDPTPPSGQGKNSAGWVGQLVLRLHFYAAIFVGPFILVAATSGALYALTPQLEQIVYAEQLHAPPAEKYLSIGDQVVAAERYIGGGETIVAVRPAPNPGDTTRVMYAAEGLGASESRAIFVDPATGEIRGDLTAYGTSGALPLRTWIDQLHRTMHLGDIGRNYSELAASWLGVIALAGLTLWIMRIRRSRSKRDFVRPNLAAKGYRRLLSWHSAIGIWVLLGALTLSATGITWSLYGGANFGTLRSNLGWTSPSINTDLNGGEATHDDHAAHKPAAESADPVVIDPASFDSMLAIARDVNADSKVIEIKPPLDESSAWVVREINGVFPSEVDAVAINGHTGEVVDRIDFAEFNLASKLTRWGIDAHMGTLFGLTNQIVLFLVAASIVTMIVLGYTMWWKRRPTFGAKRKMGQVPARGAIRRAPLGGVLVVLGIAIAVGLFLPLLGISLAAFLVADVILGLVAQRKAARSEASS